MPPPLPPVPPPETPEILKKPSLPSISTHNTTTATTTVDPEIGTPFAPPPAIPFSSAGGMATATTTITTAPPPLPKAPPNFSPEVPCKKPTVTTAVVPPEKPKRNSLTAENPFKPNTGSSPPVDFPHSITSTKSDDSFTNFGDSFKKPSANNNNIKINSGFETTTTDSDPFGSNHGGVSTAAGSSSDPFGEVNVSFGEQQSHSKNKSNLSGNTFDSFDFDRPSKSTNNTNNNSFNLMASPQASTTTRSNISGGFDFPASPEVEVSSVYSKKPSEFNFGTVPAKQQQQQQPVPVQPMVIDSLPPPPPQVIDEDPYEIHTNKPPPSVPYNPFSASINNTNKPKTPAAEEVTKKPKKEGDPFLDIIVPELSKEKEMKKAKEAENINRAKDPNAAVSLKDLAMKVNMKPPAVETPAFIQPTTATTSFQQQPPQAAPQPYPQQQQPTGFLSPGKPPVQNPFAPKQSSVPVVVPSSFAASEPFPSQADTFTKSSDPFSNHASNIDFGSNDPFGSSSVPLIASKAAAAAPPPVPVALPVDDFSVFEKPSKAAASSSQQPKQTMGLVPPQRPVSTATTTNTTTQQHKSVSFGKPAAATGRGGGGGKKVDLLSDDFEGFDAEPAHHTTAGGGFDDDPFASSYNPSDDPFASPSQPSSGHGAEGEEDQEDMFERFKIMYGQKDKDGGEGGKGDKKKSHDIYDAEFDDDDDLDLNIRSTTTDVPKGMTPGQLMAEGSTKELLDGEILARLSTRSLVTKDWNDIYYVIKKGVLFLYRTK
jgi:hypothetical protein